MKSRKEILTNIAISIGIVAVFLLAAEIYLRATYHVQQPNSCLEYDSKLLWKHQPNCSMTYEDINFSYNSRGYRDYEHAESKPPNTTRVVVIGDSVVEGHLVKWKDAFPHVLESILNNMSNSSKYEVINLGVNGYTTEQELIVLKEQALQYRPDIIVWNYVLNDPLNPVFHPASYNAPRYGFQSNWYQPKSHVLAFLKSRLFFIKERIKGVGCPREYHAFIHCAYRYEVAENLFEISNFTEEHNVTLIFLINPAYYPEGFEEYLLQKLHEWIGEVAEMAGLKVYDLAAEFRKYPVERVGMCTLKSCDIWHPSPQGHRIIAEYLAGIILNQSNEG